MAESTQRLSEDLKAKAPEVDWRALSGFRNVLVHDYLGGIDRLLYRFTLFPHSLKIPQGLLQIAP